MFRNFAFALAATAALGAAPLTSTAASAHPIGPHIGPFGHGPVFHGAIGPGPHRFGHRWPWVAAGVVGAGIVVDSCYRRDIVDTPYGPEVRWVYVCDY